MDKLIKFFNKKLLKNLSYLLLPMIMIFFLWSVGQFFNINDFLKLTEARTYDLRFKIPGNTIKPNKNIVILAIDDTSLEVMEDSYGRWPWSRNAYIEAINYLESGKVNSIVFDLMFNGYQKGFENKDIELAKTIAKYKNVYVGMNFDNRDNKIPPVLPDSLKLNIENKSKTIDFSQMELTNCRLILKEIINSTSNIGITNFKRDDDGISRRAMLLIGYQNKYYPYLPLRQRLTILQNMKILILLR